MNIVENAVNALKSFIADSNIVGGINDDISAEVHNELYTTLKEVLFDEDGDEIDEHVTEFEKIGGVHLTMRFEDSEAVFLLHTPKGVFDFYNC